MTMQQAIQHEVDSMSTEDKYTSLAYWNDQLGASYDRLSARLNQALETVRIYRETHIARCDCEVCALADAVLYPYFQHE